MPQFTDPVNCEQCPTSPVGKPVELALANPGVVAIIQATIALYTILLGVPKLQTNI